MLGCRRRFINTSGQTVTTNMSVLRNISQLRANPLSPGHYYYRSASEIGETAIKRYSSVAETKTFKKLKAMQVQMQCDDGIPVYLKKGTPDKILFYSSLALIALGSFESLRFFWKQATKKLP